MWTLLIISSLVDIDEYKVTKFNEYNTQQQCSINAAVLEALFTEGEKAVCINE